MIKINKITTKTGDKGTTLGPGMKFIKKYDQNVEFLGKLDELNASLGQIILCSRNKKLLKLITLLQNQLFDLGAMFFSQDAQNCKGFIEFLETTTQTFNANLPELNSFLLPQGSKLVVALHLSRVCARSAERIFWQIFEKFNNEKNDMEKANYHDEKNPVINKSLNNAINSSSDHNSGENRDEVKNDNGYTLNDENTSHTIAENEAINNELDLKDKEGKYHTEINNNLEYIGIYLNRFSDLLFSIARKYSKKAPKVWIPLKNRKDDISIK